MLIIILQCKKVQLLAVLPHSAPASCNYLKVCFSTSEHNQALCGAKRQNPGQLGGGAEPGDRMLSVGTTCVPSTPSWKPGGMHSCAKVSVRWTKQVSALPRLPLQLAVGLFVPSGWLLVFPMLQWFSYLGSTAEGEATCLVSCASCRW